MAGSQGAESVATSTAPNQTPETIVKPTGGDGSISFDDFEALESVTSTKQAKQKRGVKEENDEKAEAKSEPEKGTDESVEKKAEKKADKPKDEKEEADGDKKEKVEEDPKNAEKKADGKPKFLKVKNAEGQDVSIDVSTPITVTIAGKKEQFPLQDIINEFSGKTDWSRQYNALEKERRTFHTERDGLSQGLNTIYELCSTGKPMEAIWHMAEAMGADAMETWKNVVAQVEKSLGKEVSDEDRAQREKDWELAFHRNSRETAKAKGAREQEVAQAQTQVDAVQKLYGMDKAAFVAAYDELCEEAKRLGRDEKTITPEMVGKYHFSVKVATGVKNIVGTEFAEHPQKESIKAALEDTWKQNPTWTEEQVLELAKEAFPTQSKKSSLAKKVEKAKSKEPEKVTTNEPVSWDDI